MIINKELTRKRLAKRHNRHAADAGARVRLSEPDVRTPEQIRAARDASRPDVADRQGLKAHSVAPSTRNLSRPAVGNAAKAEV
jgi:hypothetical protein